MKRRVGGYAKSMGRHFGSNFGSFPTHHFHVGATLRAQFEMWFIVTIVDRGGLAACHFPVLALCRKHSPHRWKHS